MISTKFAKCIVYVHDFLNYKIFLEIDAVTRHTVFAVKSFSDPTIRFEFIVKFKFNSSILNFTIILIYLMTGYTEAERLFKMYNKTFFVLL